MFTILGITKQKRGGHFGFKERTWKAGAFKRRSGRSHKEKFIDVYVHKYTNCGWPLHLHRGIFSCCRKIPISNPADGKSSGRSVSFVHLRWRRPSDTDWRHTVSSHRALPLFLAAAHDIQRPHHCFTLESLYPHYTGQPASMVFKTALWHYYKRRHSQGRTF